MRRSIKNRWVAALRSGEYQQGQGYLCQVTHPNTPEEGKRYCCLGVLCDLAVQEGVIPAPVFTVPRVPHLDGVTPHYKYGLFRDGGVLPDEVCRWAKISHDSEEYEDPTDPEIFTPGHDALSLTQLNDGDGTNPKTFDEIADLIERYLPAEDD